ncbi:hypothetical protein Bca4012_011909 [Brassica carinata]
MSFYCYSKQIFSVGQFTLPLHDHRFISAIHNFSVFITIRSHSFNYDIYSIFMRMLSFHLPSFSSYINPFIEAHIQPYSTTSVQQYQSMAMKSVQNSGKSRRYLADNNHQAGSYIWRERTFERAGKEENQSNHPIQKFCILNMPLNLRSSILLNSSS